MKYNPNYDFSNKGVDWEGYEKEVRLRTDAVWERTKLKDYFRLFFKIFYWDPKSEKYYITLPMHQFGNGTDEWRIREHYGYNPTGKTTSFQFARGWEYPARSISVNAAETIRDRNVLCYARFRNYKKCEGNTLINKIWETDNEYGPEKVNLACYAEMMEMMDNCSAKQMNWLADLWHHMMLFKDPSVVGYNMELDMVADDFDNPEVAQLTY